MKMTNEAFILIYIDLKCYAVRVVIDINGTFTCVFIGTVCVMGIGCTAAVAAALGGM